MTGLIVEGKTTPVFSAGIGLNASSKKYGADGILILGPKVEGQVEHKGWHAGASATVGLGYTYSADVEVGKEFDINKNWGLDLSANANRTSTFAGEKSSVKITHHETVDGKTNTYTESAEWRPGITTAGVKAMANYTTNNGKFTLGAGLSGQYATNNAKNISLTTGPLTSSYYRHKEGIVVSPELAFEVKPTQKLSFGAKGNIFGAGVTVKYNF